MTEPDAGRQARRQLADTLRERIAGGAYPAGTRLPSYRRLRDEHHVALNTAQAAVRVLAAEGLVEIRPGSGAYVRQDTRPGAGPGLRSELAGLQAMLRQARQDLAAAEQAAGRLLARLQAEETPR